MSRTATGLYNPFVVTVTITENGLPISGKTLTLSIPKGSVSAVSDIGNGQYQFTVTPAFGGTYPVTVSFGDATITRKALVLDTVVAGAGQAMAVPGDYVNTDGYEDGATITPDGQYLFVQYGPVYFSGVFSFTSICSSGLYSAGYDLNTCSGRTNSSIVFNTIGPTGGPHRPNFPQNSLKNNTTQLRHIPELISPGFLNGLASFPTNFYGFKKQSDGTFAEPFRVAFNDDLGTNGPYGLSFKMNTNGTATFLVAWDNYLNHLGDSYADIYTGTMTMGQDFNLGDVTYSGVVYTSITPNISPVGFSSHTGTQGNPHLYYDNTGTVKSIWTDDENISHNLSVYTLNTGGTFPAGPWTLNTLPAAINTAADESQPFFTGTKLILTRAGKIVYHDYTPLNGACSSGFTHANCWGAEVILLAGSGSNSASAIQGVGEPTIASVGTDTYLYFIYVEPRLNISLTGITDYDLNVGFIKIP